MIQIQNTEDPRGRMHFHREMSKTTQLINTQVSCVVDKIYSNWESVWMLCTNRYTIRADWDGRCQMQKAYTQRINSYQPRISCHSSISFAGFDFFQRELNLNLDSDISVEVFALFHWRIWGIDFLKIEIQLISSCIFFSSSFQIWYGWWLNPDSISTFGPTSITKVVINAYLASDRKQAHLRHSGSRWIRKDWEIECVSI